MTEPIETNFLSTVQFAQFESSLTLIIKNQEKIMASLASILAAQQQEKTDLGTLAGLVQQLLAAFAAGTITPAQAAEILANSQADDATITSLVSNVQAALPAPSTPASGTGSSSSTPASGSTSTGQ